MKGKLFKEVWEGNRYDPHHVCVMVRKNELYYGDKYDISWKYGNYGFEQGWGYTNDYIKVAREIILKHSKNRQEEPTKETVKESTTNDWGDLFG